MVTNELTTTRATPLQVARARGRVRGRLILLGPAFVAAVALNAFLLRQVVAG
ncbi:hypothetical protein [Micromonospora sp. NBC_00617]|uniref:hypothetical protein n=1 Tax=Micromonospora sp. NBC_00617 TaxID=2903587 RepID=UPI0030DF53F0